MGGRRFIPAQLFARWPLGLFERGVILRLGPALPLKRVHTVAGPTSRDDRDRSAVGLDLCRLAINPHPTGDPRLQFVLGQHRSEHHAGVVVIGPPQLATQRREVRQPQDDGSKPVDRRDRSKLRTPARDVMQVSSVLPVRDPNACAALDVVTIELAAAASSLRSRSAGSSETRPNSAIQKQTRA
jgi:hypothetical protein